MDLIACASMLIRSHSLARFPGKRRGHGRAGQSPTAESGWSRATSTGPLKTFSPLRHFVILPPARNCESRSSCLDLIRLSMVHNTLGQGNPLGRRDDETSAVGETPPSRPAALAGMGPHGQSSSSALDRGPGRLRRWVLGLAASPVLLPVRGGYLPISGHGLSPSGWPGRGRFL